MSKAFWRGFWEGVNVLFWLAWALYGIGHLSSLIANLGGPKFWVVFWARVYQTTMLASARVQDRYGFSSPWGHIAK